MGWNKTTETQNNYSDIYNYDEHNKDASGTFIGINKTSELAGWSSSREMKELRASMDTVRKTAGEFIDSMTEVMQRLLREQPQHLKEDDLVLEYTLPVEEGKSYFVVRNMEKAELLAQLQSYHELHGESREKGIDTFLQEQGAEVIPWYDSHGLQVENPVTFYDVIYHGENGLVADAAGYPPVIQAALLMDRAEYQGEFLSDSDKLLITRYAEKTADMDRVKGLLRDFEAASRAPDPGAADEVRRRARAEINGISRPGREDGLDPDERSNLSGQEDRYAIYQIADDTKGRDYQFMGMDYVTSHNIAVDAADYRFVYGGRLADQDTLDSLYERFNTDHPADYTGHSLSISDVVVMQKNGESKAYYVDRFGFAELPDFIPQRLRETEMDGKREDPPITLEASGMEAGQQEGSADRKTYPPVYRESLAYAMEHAAADEYLDSRKRNIDCRRAVEAAIHDHFDGMHLNGSVADSVLEEYGSERLAFVLACTVQHKSMDGHFSRDTKAWAERIPVPENIDRGRDMNLDYVVESHPAVLDGFIGMAREKFRELDQVQEQTEPQSFIARYYVVNDAYGVKAEQEYQYFPDLDLALTAYAALPNHLDKQIGMESTENPPTRMSLINCRNGIEELNDIKSVSLSGKWVNAKTEEALKQAKDFLKEHDPEIAYQMGDRYFFIQTIPEGYDYTFYNADFSDIDGGILDQPGLPIRQAIGGIVEDFAGEAHPPLKAVDAAAFLEKVDAAGKGEIGQAHAALTAGEEAEKELPLISDSVKPEKSLNWKSRAEIEETVLCFAQAQINEMGLTDEVKLLGARVYGSRTRPSLAKDGADLDVVISYNGNIREDAFFNALHEGGLEIACLPVDMNPISLEKTGTLDAFMKEAETYLDGKEAEKLAADMVTFSYYHETYDYLDTSDDREGQIRGIAQDISEGNISGLEDWMQAVIRENRDPKETAEAKELLQRLIDRTDRQRYTACETTDAYEEPFTVFDRVNADYYQDKDGFTPLFATEREAQGRAAEINAAFQAEREAHMEPEPKISFYVAECMEYPVLGEYHNSLTLQEAVDLYNQIPAERINGIKGIGFCLEDGSMYDGENGLMSAGVIDKEFVNSIPHFKESPLVQKAIVDLEAILEKGKGLEPIKNVQEQAEEAKDSPMAGNLHEAAAEPGKPQKTAPETDMGKEKGVGRKQSVLQALRERQAKLKAQESQKPEKEKKAHRKGEQEL